MTRTTAILSSAMTALALAVPSTASAMSPTFDASSHRAGPAGQRGVPRERPATAEGAGALCLVDTGVNTNPDTTAGLIASYAIDNGATGDVPRTDTGRPWR